MPVFDPEELQVAPAAPFDDLVTQEPGKPTTPVKATRPVKLRGFDDMAAQRQAIFDNVKQSYAQKVVEGKDHILKFADVDYQDPTEFTRRDEKNAIMGRQRLYHSLVGRLQLLDKNTGQVLSEDPKPRSLAQVPYLTDRGTFIHNGNSYSVINQQRLRPGVYTRQTQDGALESQFNVKPGTGRGFRINMDPATGVFKMQVEHSQVKLYPVLKAMGLGDKEIEQAWGKELAYQNKLEDDKTPGVSLAKVVAKFGTLKDRELQPDQMPARFREIMERMELDPETTRRTLGQAHEKVTPATVLAATQKILAIGRREAEPDDRDDIPYQSFHSAEDFFKEHVEKDAGKLLRTALWKAQRHNDVSKVPNNFFSKQLHSVLMGSGVASASAEINPTETLDSRYKITRMGEGGIGSTDSVSKDARGVQPSHFGFIDPIRAPESLRIGLDLRLAQGVQRGDDGNLYQSFTNARTGKPETISTNQAIDHIVAFPGEFEKGEPLVRAMVKGKIKYVKPEQVDYVLPHATSMLSPTTNQVPLISGMKGQRAIMAARMSQQALALEHPESPLVQTRMPGQEHGMERAYGEASGAVFAKQGGTVQKVDRDSITVKHQDGTVKEYGLYDHLKANQKSFIHNTPVVKPGDLVQPGQILAPSNFTDKNGETALGANFRIGYMMADGMTHEDALVISESASNRLSSMQMYDYDAERGERIHDIGREAFTSKYPSKFNKAQLEALDENGVAKPGMIVRPGDPLVLAVGKRQPSVKGSLMRSAKSVFTDESQVWEHEQPGEVVDVHKTGKGWRVTVKSFTPMRVGDKASMRHGNKGVVSRVVPDSDMPRSKDGTPLEILLNPAGVVGRCYDDQTEFLTSRGWCLGRDVLPNDTLLAYDPATDTTRYVEQLSKMYTEEYSGELVGFKSKTLDFLVTPKHKFWAAPDATRPSWRTCTAEQMFGKRYYVPYLGQHAASGRALTTVDLPEFRNGKNVLCKPPRQFQIDDFCDFLGWYLSEGHLDIKGGKAFISQLDSANPKKVEYIGVLLHKLGLSCHYKNSTHGWVIYDTQLACWLAQHCGQRKDKRIPRDILAQAPITALSRLMVALWMGDGHASSTDGTDTRIASKIKLTAQGLIDDIQEMLVVLGVVSRKTDRTVSALRANPNSHPIWALGVHMHVAPRLTARGGWYKQAYKGTVYCPTVETGYVVTRRHGTIVVSGNTNPSVLAELALGKVARKTGKPYVLDAFTQDSIAEHAMGELRRHGLTDTETMHDPKTGRDIPEIFTGDGFMMKLHHMSEGKMDVRGETGAYSMDDLPAKGGGGGGAKRLGFLETMALISHGATGFLEDAKLIRGQRNDEFWRAYKLGMPVSMPSHSRAHDKFVETMKGAGISLHRKGTKTQVLPMTAPEIEEMTGSREITEPDTVEFDTGEPIKGGLFDISATGGDGGMHWAHIKLKEPMPNPIMEEPIKLLLGLNKEGFQKVLAGEQKLHNRSGGEGMREALKRLNIEREIQVTKDTIKSGKRQERDKAVKRLGVLTTLHKNQIDPSTLIWDKLPVIPPKFRPVAKFGKTELIADANALYKDVLEANKNLEQHRETFGGGGETTGQLYDAVKAVTGLGNPVAQESQEQGVKGLLKQVLGTSPKYGYLQRKVIGSSLDLVGRGVIVPDVNLDLDEVGVPAEMAWTLYKPFVIRRMVKAGMPATQALKAWEARDTHAQKAIDQELVERPAVINRAPSLHKFNLTGAKVTIVPGNALRIPVGILAGHGADYDGDSGRFVLELSVPSGTLWRTYQGTEMPFSPSTDVATTVHTRIQDIPVVQDSKVEISAGVSEYDVQPGVLVYALDPKTLEHRQYPVTKLSVHQDLDMRLVTIGRRYTSCLSVSADHSLICYRDGVVAPVRPDEAKGLMVPVVRHMHAPGGEAFKQVNSSRPQVGRVAAGETRSVIAEEAKLPLNRELGFFLGALVGDGWIDVNHVFYLSNDDPDVRARWLEAGATCTPATTTGHVVTYDAPSLGDKTTTRHRVNMNCAWLGRWLKPYVGDGAKNKRIPSWSYDASDEHLMGILDGLISTDGCVGLNTARAKPQLTVSVCSISLDLIHDIQYLARRLGVQTSITLGRMTQADNRSYVVTFSVPDFVAFQQRTGFRITAAAKQARIDTFAKDVALDSPCTAATDLVPYPRHLHARIRAHVRAMASSDKEAEARVNQVCAAATGGYWSRSAALSCTRGAEALEGFQEYLAILADTKITWKQVVDVQVAPRETAYDLTVPGPLTFATYDGVIVQDTLNVHVPVSDKAVHDVWDKMMPSKMLIQPKNFGVHILPPHGFLVGLFMGSKSNEKRLPRTFATTADVRKAYKSGDLDPDDPVVVLKP